MVRLLGVEIATLLILGFTIGALVFMYLNTRKELSELHDDNDRLQNQLLESSSVSKTAHYQEKLVQSDLKQLQIKDRDSVARISNLTQQVKNMLEQLVSLVVILVRFVGIAVPPPGGHRRVSPLEISSYLGSPMNMP